MCVHNPCEHYWADIVADRDLLRATARPASSGGRARRPRSDEELLHLHAQPLLAAWGKQGRDFIGLLDEHDDDAARAGYLPHSLPSASASTCSRTTAPPPCCNNCRTTSSTCAPWPRRATHWPAVDPARDARSASMSPTARSARSRSSTTSCSPPATPMPRCARATSSSWCRTSMPTRRTSRRCSAASTASDPRYMPFSVADQGQRQVDPLVQALEKLLDLPQSRLAVSDLLDLLDVPALRQRFGIAEDELPQLQRWIHGANIRWGLHAEQRASLDLPQHAEAATPGCSACGGCCSATPSAPRRGLAGTSSLTTRSAASTRPARPAGAVARPPGSHLADAARAGDRRPRLVPHACAPAGRFLRPRRQRRRLHPAAARQRPWSAGRTPATRRRWSSRCPCRWSANTGSPARRQGACRSASSAASVTFATLMPMRAIPFRRSACSA
jgi:exodeoxyribonuclease V gamma subunit